MTVKTKRPTSVHGPSSRLRFFLAALTGIVWAWAVSLLTTRHHLVGTHRVVEGAPPLWGPIALPIPLLLLVLALAVLVVLLCEHCLRTSEDRFPRAIQWLLLSSIVPLLDFLRLLGVPIPLTFIEPLLLAAITAYVVGEMSDVVRIPLPMQQRVASIPWLGVVWIAAVGLGIWWYWQSVEAYNHFLLGFNDFGHFGQRVANTWAGRGFLMETPSLPPFWDHFNPGLALLAPLWGLWPDPRLFMAIQAFCLAVSAPVVYAIARQLNATRPEAAMWAAAYLTYPPVSQLNLSYSYGWHPVSLALPLLFLALWLLLKGQRVGLLVAAALACIFREDVIVMLGCLAAAMVLHGMWKRWRHEETRETNDVASMLPLWAWAAINLTLVVVFVVVYEFSGFRQFQVSRFQRLGDTGLEIIASPLLRPAAFWGTVLRPESAYFLSALLIPLGFRSLSRGAWILLACLLPVGVLIAWGHRPATSIAFQYTTTLIPILFLAAMAGAGKAADRVGVDKGASPMWRGTMTALAGCMVASLWLGSSPWCRHTATDVIAQTYADVGLDKFEDRLPGTAGIEALHHAVALVREEGASGVLATGRLAAHFVGAPRLDTIGQAPARWAAFEAEAGPGRSGIELFEWVVVDNYERFQQSSEDIQFVLNEAEKAGYRPVDSRHGILVLRRPGD